MKRPRDPNEVDVQINFYLRVWKAEATVYGEAGQITINQCTLGRDLTAGVVMRHTLRWQDTTHVGLIISRVDPLEEGKETQHRLGHKTSPY